jgi:hypothetical protein
MPSKIYRPTVGPKEAVPLAEVLPLNIVLYTLFSAPLVLARSCLRLSGSFALGPTS